MAFKELTFDGTGNNVNSLDDARFYEKLAKQNGVYKGLLNECEVVEE